MLDSAAAENRSTMLDHNACLHLPALLVNVQYTSSPSRERFGLAPMIFLNLSHCIGPHGVGTKAKLTHNTSCRSQDAVVRPFAACRDPTPYALTYGNDVTVCIVAQVLREYTTSLRHSLKNLNVHGSF
jgi:hypothetical protein